MKKTEEWQQYLSPVDDGINQKPNLATVADIKENPYVGILDWTKEDDWNRRPNYHKRLIYPVSFEINYDWKDYYVVKNFLTEQECDDLILYIQNNIENEESLYEYDENNTFSIIKPNSNKIKIWNPYLEKYEFISNRDNINNDLDYKHNWRNSTTTFMMPWEYRYGWFWKKTSEEIKILNEKIWKFDISNPVTQEPLQLAEYNAPSGNYDWHKDWSGKGYTGLRKLSYVIQLSDPKDYEGGYLQVTKSDSPNVSIPMQKDRGSLIVFPSLLTHRLTEVTKGVRYSAVGWVAGNHWR
tara:strand:- start:866 stop:1753 length:888 start_codon:yes stop_codon:yes gene_type:complete